jgi:hypothetical protein
MIRSECAKRVAYAIEFLHHFRQRLQRDVAADGSLRRWRVTIVSRPRDATPPSDDVPG